MKKTIALIICLLMFVAGVAIAEDGEYQYIQTDDGIYICGYSGADAIISIPESIDGQPVTGISEGAFKNNAKVVELFIPDNCKVIEEEAFAGCIALRDVYLGSGLTNINARAFADCSALLSVSIVQYDFEEDPTAFDGARTQGEYNGTDVEYFWNTTSGDDYDLLYVAACEMMSRGEFEQARDLFLSLYGYELSADNYFYCAARVYERRGEIDAACAIYALMPDLNDCRARLEYYNGTQEVATFFDAPDYTVYYDAFFGNGGRYESRIPEALSAEATTAPNEDNSLIIGGTLSTESEATAEPTVAPTAEPVVTLEPNPALMSYHNFADEMPFEFDDRSNSEGYYAMYHYYDDLTTVEAYIALFEEQGWLTYSEAMNGWTHIYVSSPDQQTYFYISYAETDQMLIFMYEATMDYGFNPKEGL
ncbi:MAG: leucine-rich repeat protein [Clostridia bacterium]|nr:leucine-rich repeat protein [Clostridia bacterium]